jgi:hypothetical protein
VGFGGLAVRTAARYKLPVADTVGKTALIFRLKKRCSLVYPANIITINVSMEGISMKLQAFR